MTCSGPLPHDPYVGTHPPVDITAESGVLFDESRGLGLTYWLHRPAHLSGPHPVVIYSKPMDWGGRHANAPSARYIAEQMARAGYLVVNVAQMDSDRFILPLDISTVHDVRKYMYEMIRDPAKPHQRFLDFSFLIDTVVDWNAAGSLAGHIDTGRIGMCGHSFGARTTMALIGERIGPSRRSYRDARIKAAIIYSLAPSVAPEDPADVYGDIRIPVCVMAGSRDFSWDKPAPPEDRVRPYFRMDAPAQYKVVLKGADHLTFPGGRADKGVASTRERRNHQFIRSISQAFWDAHLREDDRARGWLGDDLRSALRGNGSLEFRPGAGLK